jgi:hypothetical protein
MIQARQSWLFRAPGIIEAGVPPGALPIRVCVRSRFLGNGEDTCDGLLAMVLADTFKQLGWKDLRLQEACVRRKCLSHLQKAVQFDL